MLPKVTILTPALHEDKDFETTFESLRYLAGSRLLNWIVIKKSDRRNLRALASGCVVISGPDEGLYHALNNGLSVCETSFFQVIGIGDTILAENEARAIELISDPFSIYTFPIENGPSRRLEIPNPEGLSRQMTCPHPGVFCPLDKVLALNGFSTSYQISGDYDLLSRLAISGIKFYKSMSLPVAHFKGGGLSDLNPLVSGLENALVKKRIWNQSEQTILEELISFTRITQ